MEWQSLEEKKKEASALKLNSQSGFLSQDDRTLDKSILLAIKSFQIRRTLEADQLILQGLLLIPRHAMVLNHDDRVYNVTFSPDGKYIATASNDNTSRVWNAATGTKIFDLKHNNSVWNVAFSPDGKYVATASADKTARLWNASTGEPIFVLNHTNWVWNVVFSPDGKYVATASDDKKARVWDAATGKPIFVLKHNDSVNSVVFSPDGKYVATASDDNAAHLWDAFTGKPIFVLNHGRGVKYKIGFSPADDGMNNVVFSPDGKYVATASDDNTARLWDAFTGKPIFVLNHNAPVNKVIFVPADRRVNNVVFSPDGKYVATASGDKTARLWDAATGIQILVMNHDKWVNYVAFSPDGKYVATACADGTARVYLCNTEDLIKEACDHRLTRNLTPEEWKDYVGDEPPYHKTCPNITK